VPGVQRGLVVSAGHTSFGVTKGGSCLSFFNTLTTTMQHDQPVLGRLAYSSEVSLVKVLGVVIDDILSDRLVSPRVRSPVGGGHR
jgi:hypothetical protein